MYILCFHDINSPYYLLFFYCSAPLLLRASSEMCYFIFMHRCKMFEYFLLSNILFSLPTSSLSPQKDTLTQSCSLIVFLATYMTYLWIFMRVCVCVCVCVWRILAFEFWASFFLGRCSIILAMIPVSFYIDYFGDRFYLFPRPTCTCSSYFKLPSIARMTGAQPYIQFFPLILGS
jgi:hypothetical protein